MKHDGPPPEHRPAPPSAPPPVRTFRHFGSRGPDGPQTFETDPVDKAGWPGTFGRVADLYTHAGRDFVVSITIPPFVHLDGLVVCWGNRVFGWNGEKWTERCMYVCTPPFGERVGS